MFWGAWIMNFKLIIHIYTSSISNPETDFNHHFIKYTQSNENSEENLNYLEFYNFFLKNVFKDKNKS